MPVARPAQSIPTTPAPPRRPRLRLVQSDLRRVPPAWEPLLAGGVRPLLVAGDVGACLISLPAGHGYLTTELGFGLILVVLFYDGGLYRSRLSLSVLDDLPCIIRRWLMAVAMLLGGSLLFGVATGLEHAFAVGVAVVLTRALLYFLVRTLRRSGTVAHPTIVVGAEHAGRDVVNQLRAHPESGLRPLGFLDRDSGDLDGLVLPLIGGPSEVAKVLERHQPHALLLTQGAMREEEAVTLVRACQKYRCEVFVLPRLHEVTPVIEGMDFLGDLPLIRLRRAAYRTLSWQLKRLVDVVFSAVALLVLSPVLAACAIAVRLEGGPGVIFRQERIGRDGVRFQLLKFRSMRPANEQESRTQWNIATDNRVGPVGRLLRITSLDELPQLFNILRGDMSVVGPRPERPHFVEEFGRLYRGYHARHRVPCGLTGWAQIHGLRGNTSIDARARLDNFYIENWSLWLDMKIILRTTISVFTSPGS
jgi:exopolysaccharide biosynthesis polyprenyl glycosylphosphotransferase